MRSPSCSLATLEAENWPEIVGRLPSHTTYLQVPHHGGRNGLFDPNDGTPWLDHLNPRHTRLVMSSHVVPHGHPHPDVVTELSNRRLGIPDRSQLSPHAEHDWREGHGRIIPRQRAAASLRGS